MKNFDIFNIYLPILNRACIFMQDLQNDPALKWDQILPERKRRAWAKIAGVFNKIPPVVVDRFIGEHTDSYSLLASVDASGQAIGLVIHILNVNSGRLSFLCAKNQLLSKRLRIKSIPSLELFAIAFGLQAVADIVSQLTSNDVIRPLKITKVVLFSDSMVALGWIYKYAVKFKNFNSKNPVFVKNKLSKISELIERADFPKPISFRHLAGKRNPSDVTTRVASYRQVASSAYCLGSCYVGFDPSVGSLAEISFDLPIVSRDVEFRFCTVNYATSTTVVEEQLLPLTKFRSFRKLVAVTAYILQFVNKIKTILHGKDITKFAKLKPALPPETNWFQLAKTMIISRDQKFHLNDCFSYLQNPGKRLSDTPNLIKQLNIFPTTAVFAYERRTQEAQTPSCVTSHSSYTGSLVFPI